MNPVKFFHVRFTNDNGEINPRGGMTYAYRELESGGVEYALAQCNHRDNFRKSYGRDKAAGRLNSLRHRGVFAGDIGQFREAVYEGVI